MDVLITGAYGTVGTAILDHLSEEHEFALLDREDPPEDLADYETYQADVTEYEAIRPAFDGRDAVIHLANTVSSDDEWEDVYGRPLGATGVVLQAAREAGVEQVIYASSNHAQGMYEKDDAPDIYYPDFDLTVDHTDPVRPDSFYGTSKVQGEALGRQYVELYDAPSQFHALRICSVRPPEYDHGLGDAERGVDRGDFERGSEAYEERAARMKAMWQSRRDLAQEVQCCLEHDEPGFDVFYGVSDNEARWFDLEHARETIGYEPEDSGEEWDEPPE